MSGCLDSGGTGSASPIKPELIISKHPAGGRSHMRSRGPHHFQKCKHCWSTAGCLGTACQLSNWPFNVTSEACGTHTLPREVDDTSTAAFRRLLAGLVPSRNSCPHCAWALKPRLLVRLRFGIKPSHYYHRDPSRCWTSDESPKLKFMKRTCLRH